MSDFGDRRARVQFASVMLAFLASCVGGHARADAVVDCNTAGRLSPSVQLSVVGQNARVQVDVARSPGADGKLTVAYGDETYTAPFDSSGHSRIAFAQTEDHIAFQVVMSEVQPITCKLTSPEFSKIYRVILRWHDPVVLGLNILEPGGQYGGVGHIFAQQTNEKLDRGIGRMDIDTGAPEDGSTGEMSYVVANRATIPPNSVIGAKVDYVTRGSNPEPPYCDGNPLATPDFYFITVENGQARSEQMSMNRAACHGVIPANRRLMPIR